MPFRKIKQHPEIVISLILLTISAYYFVGAQKFRHNLKQVNPGVFNDGDIVKISDAIDGDEIKIAKNDGSHTVVRIVGIQSNSIQTQWGGQCFDYIKNHFVGKTAKIFLNSKKDKADKTGRVLAYVHIEADGQFIRDIGLELVAEGLVIVYTKYDFTRIKDYLQDEGTAENQKKGLWGDTDAAKRAKAFKLSWQQAREKK